MPKLNRTNKLGFVAGAIGGYLAESQFYAQTGTLVGVIVGIILGIIISYTIEQIGNWIFELSLGAIIGTVISYLLGTPTDISPYHLATGSIVGILIAGAVVYFRFRPRHQDSFSAQRQLGTTNRPPSTAESGSPSGPRVAMSSPRAKSGCWASSGCIFVPLILIGAGIGYFIYNTSRTTETEVHVAGETGRDISDAHVLIFYGDGPVSNYSGRDGIADFLLEHEDDLDVRVFVTADEHEVYERGINIPYDPFNFFERFFDVDTRLQRESLTSGTLVIRVVNHEGEAVDLAEVLLITSGESRSELTDLHGLATFEKVPLEDGKAQSDVTIIADDFKIENQNVTLLSGDIQNVRLDLETETLHISSLLGPEQIEVGRSLNGQPIEATRFGVGSKKVIFVGGIHAGFAPSTVDLANQSITYFTENPSEVPGTVTLYIIPSLNPDSIHAPGELAGRKNASGTDLNRNWDCNWVKDPVWRGTQIIEDGGGTKPFSEPETDSLRIFIEDHQPTAVIFWQAFAQNGLVAPGSCDGRTQVSNTLAQTYGRATGGYEVANYTRRTNQVVNGDASDWADSQKIPAIAVLLTDYEQVDWEGNLAGMLAVLNQQHQLEQ